MNKQELIDELKKLLAMPSEIQGHNYGLRRAIALAKQLNEPVRPPEPKPLEIEKPVVPQFVADWYEEHKDDFEYSIQCLCVQGCEPVRQIDIWFDNDDNKPIVTLVKMKLFGYEVEKKKLYTVEIPIANSPLGYHYVLRKTISGEIIIDSFFTDNWGNYDYCHLTEEEIKKDHGWAWKYAKKV